MFEITVNGANVTRNGKTTKGYLNHDGSVYVEEMISPEFARELLKKNINNRNLKINKIPGYVKDMQEGNWKRSNDLICVNIDGTLRNGQNRLTAITKSKVAQFCGVYYNCPDDMICDRGTSRSDADEIIIQGLIPSDIPAGMASRMAKAAINYERCDSAYHSYSVYELSDYINTHIDGFRYVLKATKESKTICNDRRIRAVLLRWYENHANEDDLNRFIEVANSRCYTNEGDKMAAVFGGWMLDPNITKAKKGVRGNHKADIYVMLLCDHAVKDFLAGKSQKRVYRSDKLEPVFDVA